MVINHLQVAGIPSSKHLEIRLEVKQFSESKQHRWWQGQQRRTSTKFWLKKYEASDLFPHPPKNNDTNTLGMAPSQLQWPPGLLHF